MRVSGFKGYGFGADEQPQRVLVWEPIGTATKYTFYQRGRIEPLQQWTIFADGRRIEANQRARYWTETLGPQVWVKAGPPNGYYCSSSPIEHIPW